MKVANVSQILKLGSQFLTQKRFLIPFFRQGGQYVSVYIENRSADPVTMTNKSSFSGHLIGS